MDAWLTGPWPASGMRGTRIEGRTRPLEPGIPSARHGTTVKAAWLTGVAGVG